MFSLRKLFIYAKLFVGMNNKVLVIGSTFPRWKKDTTPGFVYDLCRFLRKKGHEIIVLAPHYLNSKKYEEIDGLKIYRFQYFYPAKLQKLCYDGGILPNLRKSIIARIQVPFLLVFEFFMIIRLIIKEKINVVHAHWILPQGILGAIICTIFRIPLIISVHAGDIFPLKNKFLKSIAKYALEHCDYCTVNSTYTKKAVLNISNNIKKIEIIPMGVDLTLFTSKKTKQYKLSSKNPQILTVGRLAEKKGFKYLIRAMVHVVNKFRNAELRIIGAGPEKNRLISLSRDLYISDSIIFEGEIENRYLPKYYLSSDIFVLPSIITETGDTEGLGVVILEALSCNTPVIASNVGGIPDIIIHNKTGLLVKQKNVKDLSSTIIKLLRNEKLRMKLANDGCEHVRRNFSWNIVTNKFDLILKMFN